jgi:orotate phosphoribosyltransferase
MAAAGFVRHSDTPFKLKSGIMSHVYVFGREDLTDNPELGMAVGHAIARIVFLHIDVDDNRQPCLIGIPTAGNALAAAASLASLQERKRVPWPARPIAYRIMREQLKQHGAHSTWVNGKPDLDKHNYWLVDNVATDGKSKFEAAEKLEQDGYPAKQMPCLIWIDRQQGAIPRLKAAGFRSVIVVYNLLDITFAFGEMGMWPKDAVKAVEEEIAAHQFKV